LIGALPACIADPNCNVYDYSFMVNTSNSYNKPYGGNGRSTGQVGMKGIFTRNGSNYMDLSFSSIGPSQTTGLV
jgi:hypothetical protein